MSEKEAPIYSKVGQGIVFLLQGNRGLAEQNLQALRPFAARRFPVLAKTMGWIGQEEGFSIDLLHAPLEKLIPAEKTAFPHQKVLKGWLALRIGDRKAATDVEKAKQLWILAEKWDSSLHLDVLKREFLSELYAKEPQSVGRSFFQFYRALMKHSAVDARALF